LLGQFTGDQSENDNRRVAKWRSNEARHTLADSYYFTTINFRAAILASLNTNKRQAGSLSYIGFWPLEPWVKIGILLSLFTILPAASNRGSVHGARKTLAR
jgi:hypothetical protein